MAGIANWFTFTSKEERKQQEEDYYRQMFPMGEAQRRREEELLELCIMTAISSNEKVYQLQLVKEALRKPEEEKKRMALKKWYQAALAKKLTPGERAMVLALGDLEQGCRVVEELPSPEEIRQRSQILMEELIPKLQADSVPTPGCRGWFRKLLQK